MKVVILCGGKGTRLKEHSEGLPKPLVEIGGVPIVVHIMRIYAHYGFTDFILCLGFKALAFEEYFEQWRIADGLYQPITPGARDSDASSNDWKIIFADTGLETNTGGRIKKIEPHIDGPTFFATYGDGLADIDMNELLSIHKSNQRIATITCVNPMSPFGIVKMSDDSLITGFEEKPVLKDWINGGFFVFQKEILDYIGENDILERAPFEKLVEDKQISGNGFQGFWQCMDSFKDYQYLTNLWESGSAPWCVWRQEK